MGSSPRWLGRRVERNPVSVLVGDIRIDGGAGRELGVHPHPQPARQVARQPLFLEAGPQIRGRVVVVRWYQRRRLWIADFRSRWEEMCCYSRELGRCWLFSFGLQVWPGDVFCNYYMSLA